MFLSFQVRTKHKYYRIEGGSCIQTHHACLWNIWHVGTYCVFFLNSSFCLTDAGGIKSIMYFRRILRKYR